MLFFRFYGFPTLCAPIGMRTSFAFRSKLIMIIYELFDPFKSNLIYFLLLFDFDLDALLFTSEFFLALFVGVAAKYSLENA